VFNLVSASIVWLFYPETMNLALESVDLLFISDMTDSPSPSSSRKRRFYQRLQWEVVPKVWDMVRASKVKKNGVSVDETGHGGM
jgi:hypothetical protein